MIVTANGALVLSPIAHEEENMTVSSTLIQALRRCNSFLMQGMVSVQGKCWPLYVNGLKVGLVRPDVANHLLDYPQVFQPSPNAFTLNPQLDTYTKRSKSIELVLRDLRSKDVLQALRGWREECFSVWADFGMEPLFEVERSAVTILGTRAFGVHITGYTRDPDSGHIKVWLQKRSLDKPTYPGMMDSMVGGGITAGLTPHQIMIKESQEEAGIPEHLVTTARAGGTVSFWTETERGLHANTEFVYDLELPHDFVPHNMDGEVDSFECVPVQEFLERVTSAKYKLTSVPIAIDFLVRHGFITPDTEPEYPTLIELLHSPLHQLYLQGSPPTCPSEPPTL